MDERNRRRPAKPKAYHYGGGPAGLPRAPGDHSHYGSDDSPRSWPPRPVARPAPHRGSHATAHTHTAALDREHATVQAFDAGSYTATIVLARSPDASLAGIPVSRAISASLLVAGAVVAVLFFDPNNVGDAMIVGVWSEVMA